MIIKISTYIIYILHIMISLYPEKIFNPLHSLATMRKTNDVKMNCKREREYDKKLTRQCNK